MKVIWTPEAQQDRLDIWEYVAQESPQAAANLDAMFSKAALNLSAHPELGRAGKIAGTRELYPHENYRLGYEIEDRTIWVLVLVHTARRWPPIH